MFQIHQLKSSLEQAAYENQSLSDQVEQLTNQQAEIVTISDRHFSEVSLPKGRIIYLTWLGPP